MTGYVDAHVHIRSSSAFAQLAAAGITAVRDAGCRTDDERRSAAAEFNTSPVKVVSALWALFKKGGYGSQFGVPVRTRDEIKAEILGLKQAGADIIKVMASGMVSLKRSGTITPGGFDRDDLVFIVEEAGREGLAVMAHANGEAAINAAAEAGVRSIEHGFFMTPAALETMAKRNVHWIPTIGALERPSASPGITAAARSYIKELIEAHVAMIARARAIGVPLAVGTDAVLPDPRYREYYEEELAWFARAGISRSDVEAIAREGGARLLEIIR